jgi:glycosyltransferase involved in cell wall biosynthesis
MRRVIPVSVVMPTYNAAPTIVRAINSVLNQTCLPQEVIVIDDGSSDDTNRLLESLVSSSKIVPIHLVRNEENVGPGSARNQGWSSSLGSYIAFLDSDDSWHPEKLEIQFNWMRRNPDILITGHKCEVCVDANLSYQTVNESDFSIRRYGLGSFLVGNKLSTPTVMISKSLHHRFTNGQRYCEDYNLWLDIVADGNEVVWLNCTLTFLHKAKYGMGGLSGKIWSMEKGELAAIYNLRRKRKVGYSVWVVFSIWSLLKFMRRLVNSFSLKHRVVDDG